MAIKIINDKSVPNVLPKGFQRGKVYVAIDTHGSGTHMVLGCRHTEVDNGLLLVGIGVDTSATPWYSHDTDCEFREVDIEVKVMS